MKTFKEYCINEGKEDIGKNVFDDIIELFQKVENPKDTDHIHVLADKLKISPHAIETQIYALLSSFIRAGRAYEKGVTESDVDPKELKTGIKIEMEHVSNKWIAKRIALDHLAEFPDYYTRLVKMEKEAEKKG